MGTHGLTGFKHVLLGSVAERTLRTAPCPVLTVKLRDDQVDQAEFPSVVSGRTRHQKSRDGGEIPFRSGVVVAYSRQSRVVLG